MAFVSQDVPDLCTDRRVVAPIAPLAARAFASSGGFEGFEGFAADEGTSPDGSEEQQHIRSQTNHFLQTSDDTRWEHEVHLLFAPLPPALFIGEAEAQRGGSGSHIEG